MTSAAVARADLWVGCVVDCESGVARVLTDAGEVRASYSGGMLGRLARDRQCAAGAGDWVVLRRWSDNRVTIEDVWQHERRCADVIELHPS